MISTLNEYIKDGIAVYAPQLEAIAIEYNDKTRKHIEELDKLPREENGWTTGLVTVEAHTSLDDWIIVQGFDPKKHKIKSGVREVDFIALKPNDRLIFVIDRERKYIRLDVMRM